MKLKNMLICLVTLLISLFVIEVKAQSSAPSSFNVNASDLELLYGSNYLGHGSTLNFSYKKNANGDIIYCTEIHDSMVSSGSEKYTLNGEMDAKFAYVLLNGYPNKSISGDKKKDYYITGLAVWYLIAPNDTTFSNFNLEKGTYKGYDSYVVKEVAKLVNGAKKYSYTNPTLKINLENDSLTLSKDGKYYVSSSISIKTTGTVDNYTVSLSGAPSGTIVTDKDGNTKSTFSKNETFLVKVPVSSIKELSSQFKVSVSANGTINKVYKYSPANSNNQSTAVMYPETKKVTDSVTVKYSTTIEVPFLKVDAETGEAISGAELKLSDSNGKVIKTWTSTKDAVVVKGLKEGTYTLTETKAPNGYKMVNASIKFSIDKNGNILDASGKKIVKIVITNERKTGGVEISKQDITNKEELPGATLVVKDTNGKVIDEWVSTDKPHYIEKLTPGKYTLTETIAPEGYVLSEETINFTVKDDGSITKVVMYNTPKTGGVVISKQDITNKEELPGATLVVKDSKGKVINEWVSTDKPHYIEKLTPGMYTLTETIAPEGYVLSDETITFTVKDDGTITKVVMYNAPSSKDIPVEPTSSFKSMASTLIGTLVIALGSFLIFKNYKKKENV